LLSTVVVARGTSLQETDRSERTTTTVANLREGMMADDPRLIDVENDPFWQAAAERAKDDDGCAWVLLLGLALPVAMILARVMA